MYIPINADGRPHADCGRPELAAGSVEYIASAEYTVRAPMPPCYCFVLDVSQHAVHSGLLAAACASIAAALDGLTERNSVSRIGFIAYDSAVHFFNLNGGAAGAPQMMTVGDLDDPFPPLPDDHYVTLDAARAVVDQLLQSLPQAFETTTVLDTAMGSALQVRDNHAACYATHLCVCATAGSGMGPSPSPAQHAQHTRVGVTVVVAAGGVPHDQPPRRQAAAVLLRSLHAGRRADEEPGCAGALQLGPGERPPQSCGSLLHRVRQ